MKNVYRLDVKPGRTSGARYAKIGSMRRRIGSPMKALIVQGAVSLKPAGINELINLVSR